MQRQHESLQNEKGVPVPVAFERFSAEGPMCPAYQAPDVRYALMTLFLYYYRARSFPTAHTKSIPERMASLGAGLDACLFQECQSVAQLQFGKEM
jgi:hypothetical protein